MNTTYMIGTVTSWFLLRGMGRRTLYLLGCRALLRHLITIGSLGFFDSTAVSWATGAILISFASSITAPSDPVPTPSLPNSLLLVCLQSRSYLLVSPTSSLDSSPTRLRLACSRPDAWNWGAKGAFLYLGTCGLILVILFFALPESRNRTAAEMDILFADGVPARKFASTKLDLYQASHHAVLDNVYSRQQPGQDSKDEKTLRNRCARPH